MKPETPAPSVAPLASPFREYEVLALRRLVAPHLGDRVADAIVREARLVKYDHTGVGYFLTVAHPSIPSERLTCDKPIIEGRVNDTSCGFIAFLERGELTLECFTFGHDTVPETIRELDVAISQEPVIALDMTARRPFLDTARGWYGFFSLLSWRRRRK
jgi:hypothetical protein